MKNTFGNNIAITLFGESHGPSVGCVIDGLAPGLTVDEEFITKLLAKRRPSGAISTARREDDRFVIESGVFNGKTTGTPVCIRIPNEDVRSDDYTRAARPGHADFAAYCKYHGYEDYRGGGHFSGRITAALVAAAGIVIPALEKKGIHIGTHIQRLAMVDDVPFAGNSISKSIDLLKKADFPVLNEKTAEKMIQKILKAKENGDSVGGVLETAVLGLPAGVGEPWFDSIESMLSHALFSIPAIKGVEFGFGFGMTDLLGSEVVDEFHITQDDNVVTGKQIQNITTITNFNGGINGGVTNGMPLIFRCAVKPTPTIQAAVNTIDLETCEPAVLESKGRHDPCIVHRAAVVVDAVTALTLCDMLVTRFGTDWLGDV